MESEFAMAKASIWFRCPHCCANEADDFEALNPADVYAVNCAACRQRFHLMILECDQCGEETALTWGATPTPEELGGAICAHCGHRQTSDED